MREHGCRWVSVRRGSARECEEKEGEKREVGEERGRGEGE